MRDDKQENDSRQTIPKLNTTKTIVDERFVPFDHKAAKTQPILTYRKRHNVSYDML